MNKGNTFRASQWGSLARVNSSQVEYTAFNNHNSKPLFKESSKI